MDLSSGAAKSRPKGAPRTAQRGGQREPVDLNQDGVKRRAAKKQQTRRQNVTVWSVFLVASLMLSCMMAGVYGGKEGYRVSKNRLTSKQAALRDLKAQLEKAQRRFSAMSSEAGKHRTLVENGFLRDGERLLLFPRDKKDTP